MEMDQSQLPKYYNTWLEGLRTAQWICFVIPYWPVNIRKRHSPDSNFLTVVEKYKKQWHRGYY